MKQPFMNSEIDQMHKTSGHLILFATNLKRCTLCELFQEKLVIESISVIHGLESESDPMEN